MPTDPDDNLPAVAAPNRVVRAADGRLSEDTLRRIVAGIPENTRRSYARVWRQFEAWCLESERTPMPATPETVAEYVAFIADTSAPSTLNHDLAGISALHQQAGHVLTKADQRAARLVIRDRAREWTDAGEKPRKAKPITLDLLLQINLAAPNTLAGARDRLLMALEFTLAGRRSELARVQMDDITRDDGWLVLRIRTSKTDRDSRGRDVQVPPWENQHIDPVRLLDVYLEKLTERGVDTSRGPLLRTITRHDTLFHRPGMSDRTVNRIVQRCAARAGLGDGYSAHSLRAGFATQAARDGIPVAIWAEHGRWSPTSPVPHGYVRAAEGRRDNPLAKMRH